MSIDWVVVTKRPRFTVVGVHNRCSDISNPAFDDDDDAGGGHTKTNTGMGAALSKPTFDTGDGRT